MILSKHKLSLSSCVSFKIYPWSGRSTPFTVHRKRKVYISIMWTPSVFAGTFSRGNERQVSYRFWLGVVPKLKLNQSRKHKQLPADVPHLVEQATCSSLALMTTMSFKLPAFPQFYSRVKRTAHSYSPTISGFFISTLTFLP